MRFARALAAAASFGAAASLSALADSNPGREVTGTVKAYHAEGFRAPMGHALELRLPPVNSGEVQRALEVNSAPGKRALQIGVPLLAAGLPRATSTGLAWSNTAEGKVAHWRTVASGAKALRVGIETGRLPRGLELRFAGNASEIVYGPFTSSDLRSAEGVYWSPVLSGEEAIIELFVPVAVDEDTAAIELAVTQVSHLFVDPADRFAESAAKNGTSDYCERDLICDSAGDAALADAGRSVMKITLTRSDGSSYLCTGTTVNPIGPLVPYALTANYCVRSQAEASALTTHWHYDRTACQSGGTGSEYVQIAGGAKLIYGDATKQVSFLRLNAPLPPGSWLSGWDSAAVTIGTSTLTIHHPDGDWKKITRGSIGGFTDGFPGTPGSQFIRANWAVGGGVTEFGSIGGPLFTLAGGEYYVRGTMVDGASYCAAPAADMWDYYTRLDQFYPSISQYLNPPATMAVTAGKFFECAKSEAGALSCWGDNGSGKLGTGEPIHSTAPVFVGGLASALSSIEASSNHTCALTTAGQVLCWGGNYFGELGNDSQTSSSTPVLVPGLPTASAIAVGGRFNCALTTGGAVYCWGLNLSGQVGNGGTGYPGGTPSQVVGLSSGVTAITAGYEHACAILAGGSMRCWGNNAAGQLGNGGTSNSSVPVTIPGLSGIVSISAAWRHTCAVTSAGLMYCWGNDDVGSGSTPTINSPVPVQRGAGTSWSTVSVGDFYTCAISASSSLYCWGRNYFNALGLGVAVNSQVASPTQVTALGTGVTRISTARTHACAVKSGSVYCWGENDYGGVGDGTTSDRGTPVLVAAMPGPVNAVAAGNFHSCAINSASRAACWGYNGDGQLGGGTPVGRATPRPVAGLQGGVLAVAAGLTHACAIDGNRAVWCWGNNGQGQLGNGSETTTPTPTGVDYLKQGMIALAIGGSHTCALDGEGVVFCWGYNQDGQIGNGTTDRYQQATAVPDVNGVIGISAGWSHSCAVRYNGEVYCWGRDTHGALGLGATTSTLVPQRVNGLPADVIAISGLLYHQCALTTSGDVWCWGNNTSGQLGDGTFTNRSTPVKVQGLPAPVVKLAVGMYHNCAVTSLGAAYCWGYGGFGQIGDGFTGDSATPIQVLGFGSGTSAIAAGSEACAVTTMGSVHCWGANNFGQLGDGTYVWRAKPVTVLAIQGAGALDTNDWYLDLAPTKAKSISPTLTPKMLSVSQLSTTAAGADFDTQIKYKTSEFNRSVNHYVFGYVPPQFFSLVKTAPGAKTEVELRAKSGKSLVFAVLTPLGWTNLQGQLIAYSQGVTSAAGAATNILNGVRLELISGARFCVGYGSTAGDMLTAESFREVLLVEGASATLEDRPCVLSGVYLDGPRGSRYGTPVTFTASVVGLTPTGAVQFYDGPLPLSSIVPLASTSNEAVRSATVTTSTLAPGMHAIGAAYSGDSQNPVTAATPLGHEVSLPTVSTRVELEGPGDSVQGRPVFFSARVTGSNPTGSVQFKDGAANLGTTVTLLNGVATLQATGLAVGAHSITAVYLGDGGNASSTSNTLVHHVYAAVTTQVALTSSPNPAAFGSAVTFTLTVTGASPTGQVTFRDGATVLAQVPLSGGSASTVITGLSLGDHVISASYSGDANNQALTSDVLVQQVTSAFASNTPNVFLTSSANPSAVGQNVTFTAIVSGGSGAATGNVTFKAGGTTLCDATIGSGSTVTCSTSGLASGVHLITASYGGNATYSAALSSLLSQTVAGTVSNPPRLGNISTRMAVLTGDNVMIGGFIIGGSAPKTVVVRGRGPSLAAHGVPNVLLNPMLSLYAGPALVASNDDWQTASNAATLQASGFAPASAQESAIYATLNPGAYTAIVSGAGSTTGVAIVEVFEVDAVDVPLINISTRGRVQTGDNVMIGGFIIQGSGPQTVVVRARGPSLIAHGVPDVLANPTLSLYDGSTLVASNDDWQTASNASTLQSSGFAPSDSREAAIYITLNPGAYTAIVQGAGGTTGVGIVEVFKVP